MLGATVLVGGLVAVLSALAVAWWREGPDAAFVTRLAYRSFLLAVVPGYVLMRIGAQWTYSREFGDNVTDPDWVNIGYIAADLGGVLLLAAGVLAGLAVRSARRGDRGRPGLPGRAATVIVAVMIVAYLVAVWAMTAKPGS